MGVKYSLWFEFSLPPYCITVTAKCNGKIRIPDKCQQPKHEERLVVWYKFDCDEKFSHVKLLLKGKHSNTNSAALKVRYKNVTVYFSTSLFDNVHKTTSNHNSRCQIDTGKPRWRSTRLSNKSNNNKTKRRRSDPVLWQKPLYQQKCQRGKVATQTTPQKSSI